MAGSGYRDYWQTLQVAKGADTETIKRAYRRLARQHHPDLNPGNKDAEARLKEINEAYEVLGDPAKRQRYEQFGRYWKAGGGSVDVDFGRYSNFDDFLGDLLGRFRSTGTPGGFSGGFNASGFPSGFSRSGRTKTMNLDAEASLGIPFADAFHGCERTLSVNDERVDVRIPAGIKPGARLRLKGKGHLQPGTGRRGDLYLHIQLLPHPVWRIEGDQLRAELPLGLDEAVLGGEVDVPTPRGITKVVIPAGIQSGQNLRLRGKGWPGSQGQGDLLLTVAIAVPVTPSAREKQLLSELAACRQQSPRNAMIQDAVLRVAPGQRSPQR